MHWISNTVTTRTKFQLPKPNIADAPPPRTKNRECQEWNQTECRAVLARESCEMLQNGLWGIASLWQFCSRSSLAWRKFSTFNNKLLLPVTHLWQAQRSYRRMDSAWSWHCIYYSNYCIYCLYPWLTMKSAAAAVNQIGSYYLNLLNLSELFWNHRGFSHPRLARTASRCSPRTALSRYHANQSGRALVLFVTAEMRSWVNILPRHQGIEVCQCLQEPAEMKLHMGCRPKS